MNAPLLRPHLARCRPACHGGPDYGLFARLGVLPEQIVDFSANINPYGPSPRVSQALAKVAVERYPDSHCRELAQALATRHSVSPEQVLVGNGSSDLIRLLAQACLEPGDPCLLIGPTFGEYRAAGEVAGAAIYEHLATSAAGFVPDIAAVAGLVRLVRPRLTFLCNPNNPTGVYLDQPAVVALAEACTDGLLVVDQAYVPFVATPWPAESLLAHGNALLLHSMTKAEALAGLRLGYLLGPATLVAQLQAIQGPWSVNAAAQAAGLAALTDQAYLQATLANVAAQKDALVGSLRVMSLRVLPSATHYFLVEVGDAAAWWEALLRHGILVRDCTSFGLPGYLRLATRRPEECARLLAALRTVIDADPELQETLGYT